MNKPPLLQRKPTSRYRPRHKRTALAVNAILGFKTMPMIALLSPALPDSASVASSALALYKALEASYPNMPQEEQRLLRHTMLDQTRPWQAMETDMPTLHAAISSDVHALVAQMPTTLSDALTAPAFVWGLTQDWIPNQASMVETILNKWSGENVHNEFLRDANAHAHIHLIRSTLFLMDQLPFDVNHLVYAKVMKHAKEIRMPYGLDRYEDNTAGTWLHWLACIAMRAQDAIEDEMGAIAHDVWRSIAFMVFYQVGFDAAFQSPQRRAFESVLDGTLPPVWKLLTLREAHADFWSDPLFSPRLNRLLSPHAGTRIMELPWREVSNENMQHKAIASNHALAKTFLPTIYPDAVLAIPPLVWSHQVGLVRTLLGHVFAGPRTPNLAF